MVEIPLNVLSFEKYHPINFQDQQSICKRLGLYYSFPSKVHLELTDAILRNYIPAKTARIVGDGNCLFRALAYAITGTERSHLKVRELICEFMVGGGQEKCWKYVKNKIAREQVIDMAGYLASTNMICQYTRGTDCEIMAAAYLFGVNIFVAFIVERIQQSKMVWHKYSYTSTSSQGPAIYIVNDCHHYEPVIELEYSTSPSYDIGEVGGSIVED